MSKLLHSGKFWLKTLIFGLLLPFLVWLGAYSALQYFFSESRIRQAAEQAFAANGQQLSFDSRRIRREWLPYPAFTLHQVRLSRPQPSRETAFSAESVQVAFSWQSLWGEPEIQSLTVSGADIYIRQTAQGQWQVADLPARGPSAQAPHNIEWKQATIHLQTLKQRLSLLQSEGFFRRSDGSFHFRAGLFAPQESRFDVSGRYLDGRLPQLHFQAASFLPGGYPFTVSWEGSAEYLTESGLLKTGQGRFKLGVGDLKLNLDAETRDWQFSASSAYLPDTQFVFTADYGAARHNGSGRISRADYQSGNLQIAALRADTALVHNGGETAINLSGSFRRHMDGSFAADTLNLTTRRTVPGTLPVFSSQWQGSAGGTDSRIWRSELHGTFDGQEARLDLHAFEEEGSSILDAAFRLGKLSLTPYLPEDSRHSALRPEWFDAWHRLMQGRELRLKTDIGSVESSGLQIDNFHALITADADQIKTETLSLSLYEGSGSGHAVFRNRPRPAWAGEIRFSDIQIKPLLQDAFRFNHLSGRGEALFSLAAAGHSTREWLDSLGGHVELTLENGAWQGISLGKLLERPAGTPDRNLVPYDAGNSTPFSYFHIEAELKDGIGHTPFLNLSSSSLNLNGQGDFDIRDQTLDYAVIANSGNNLWLPLKIGGSISRPGFALDYERATGGLQTPEQKRQALQDIFRQQWQWIQKLPDSTAEPAAPEPQP